MAYGLCICRRASRLLATVRSRVLRDSCVNKPATRGKAGQSTLTPSARSYASTACSNQLGIGIPVCVATPAPRSPCNEVTQRHHCDVISRRPVPTNVERELRQEAGIGCCLCGFPFFYLHHIVEWHVEQHFRVEDMMALVQTVIDARAPRASPSQSYEKRKSSRSTFAAE